MRSLELRLVVMSSLFSNNKLRIVRLMWPLLMKAWISPLTLNSGPLRGFMNKFRHEYIFMKSCCTYAVVVEVVIEYMHDVI